MKISGVDIRPGNIIEHQGRLWRAVKTQHTQPGKGGAYLQVELKDIRDGKFPGLTDATGGSTGSTGGWGSRTKINFPGDVTE